MATPTDDALRTLYATTKEKLSGVIKNSIANNIPILDGCRKSGSMLVVENGGRQFCEPAIIGDSQSIQGIRRGQPINVDEQTGIDQFVYTPAELGGSVHIYQRDLAMNGGEAKAVDILKAKITQLMDSLYNFMDVYLVGQNVDAAGASTAADTGSQVGWLGLKDIVPDVATQDVPGTGVSKTTYTKARSAVNTTSIASEAAFLTAQAGRSKFQAVYNSAAWGAKHPNLMVTSTSIWNAFQLSLQLNEQYVNAGGKDQAVGYPALSWMGDCKVVRGDNISNRVYALNTEFVKFKTLSLANFKLGDQIENYKSFERVAKIHLMGQLEISGPRFCAVGTAINF